MHIPFPAFPGRNRLSRRRGRRAPTQTHREPALAPYAHLLRQCLCLAAPTSKPTNGGKYLDAPWSCKYNYVGCKDPAADNYQAFIEVSNNVMCQYAGCNDTEATNYDSKVCMRLPCVT